MAEHLEIPVEGKCSGLRLLIFPQSAKAKVFEEGCHRDRDATGTGD